jgi:hypothetical protein
VKQGINNGRINIVTCNYIENECKMHSEALLDRKQGRINTLPGVHL